uniref:Uncharacterized protein n=1 Tax=Anguilla anguilla TaxID=7936 RepID=A0A0E9UQ88_ANGAN
MRKWCVTAERLTKDTL